MNTTVQNELRFSGPSLTEEDHQRLGAQYSRVLAVMKDGAWRTLPEIEQATGAPQASVSARLRDMRKPRFGSHQVNRRRRSAGLWEYQLQPSATPADE